MSLLIHVLNAVMGEIPLNAAFFLKKKSYSRKKTHKQLNTTIPTSFVAVKKLKGF